MSDLKKYPAILGGTAVRKIPFPKVNNMGIEEKALLSEVIDSALLSGFVARKGEPFFGGPKVRHFEKCISETYGVKHAVTVNSATAGLHAALAACGIGPGDEVIVPPYTMSASAAAILMCQAVPVFVDIDKNNFGLDPSCVEKNITPHTKAIVLVHLFGMPARVDEILAICRKHGLKLIEDCAQAPLARFNNQLVGTFGDAGILSFNQNKTITTGEGGVVLTNDDTLATRARLVRNHGEGIIADFPELSIENTLGWNYRMTELEAAVGIAQWAKLSELTEWRRQRAHELSDLLRGIPGLKTLNEKNSTAVYFTYPLLFDAKEWSIDKHAFVKALQAENIPCAPQYVKPIYWEPCFQQKIVFGRGGYPFNSAVYKGAVSYEKGLCPVVEDLHHNTLVNLFTCYKPVSAEDIQDVASAIMKIWQYREDIAKMGKESRV